MNTKNTIDELNQLDKEELINVITVFINELEKDSRDNIVNNMMLAKRNLLNILISASANRKDKEDNTGLRIHRLEVLLTNFFGAFNDAQRPLLNPSSEDITKSERLKLVCESCYDILLNNKNI